VLPQWIVIGVLAGLAAGALGGGLIPAVAANKPALAVLILATTVCGAVAGTLIGLQFQAKQNAPAKKK
jgi:outer membrane lipoprotein SlyB